MDRSTGSADRHGDFPFAFIAFGLGTGILGGFLIGAYFAAAIGLSLPLGPGFPVLLQLHGHLQLMGWVGLFVMGISLYFIPRFASVPIRNPENVRSVLALLVLGILLRGLSQGLMPFITSAGPGFNILKAGMAVSGILEFLGVAGYVVILARTVRSFQRSATDPTPLETVKPFFLMMLSGWILYALLNLFLVIGVSGSSHFLLHQGWNELGIRIFLLLILLPVAFAFSIRTFPIFLGTPAPDWPVRPLALIYFISVLLQLFPQVAYADGWVSPWLDRALEAGRLLKDMTILFLVWKLGVLTPSFLSRGHPAGLHPRARHPYKYSCLHDFGEFGKFELLIYSAYTWLTFGAILEGITVLSFWFRGTIRIDSDPIQHSYMLGFITLLILGMAVRMIPGFTGKRLASTGLVMATFYLGNAAAACRILPLLVPISWIEGVAWIAAGTRLFFASSGAFGLAAVSCLGINLWRTARGSRSS